MTFSNNRPLSPLLSSISSVQITTVYARRTYINIRLCTFRWTEIFEVSVRAVDTDSLNPDPDPAFQVNLFWFKIAIYLCLSSRSLQPSKESIQHFKKLNLWFFFLCLWVILLSGTGSTDLIESGSGSETLTAELRYVGAVSVLAFHIFLYLVDQRVYLHDSVYWKWELLLNLRYVLHSENLDC